MLIKTSKCFSDMHVVLEGLEIFKKVFCQDISRLSLLQPKPLNLYAIFTSCHPMSMRTKVLKTI